MITVTVWVKEYESRLKLNYEIHDKVSGKRLTKAFTSQVAVNMESGEMCLESPNVLLQQLGVTEAVEVEG